MGKPYDTEMQMIPDTAAVAAAFNPSPAAALVRELQGRPLNCVGSGGSLGAAEAVALLHEIYDGHIARAITPLELARRAHLRDPGHLLLSGGGSNPDILFTADMVAAGRAHGVLDGPLAAICAAPGSELMRRVGEMGGHALGITGVPRDGFLATHTLLMSVAVMIKGYASAHGGELDRLDDDLVRLGDLPEWMGSGALDGLRPPVSTVVALSGGLGRPAMVDFESRCHEAGIAGVMACDYRNFAHGRHQWLVERGAEGETAIVSLESPDVFTDAGDLLSLVPDHVPVVRLRAMNPHVSVIAELIVWSMRVAGRMAAQRGMDPGQPVVSTYGREMYSRESLLAQVMDRDA